MKRGLSIWLFLLVVVTVYAQDKKPTSLREILLAELRSTHTSGEWFVPAMITSNRPVDDWGKLLGDSAAVSAMLDRLLHHGHVLKCGPRSWRTKTGLPPQPAAG
jgi:hypothetical protein